MLALLLSKARTASYSYAALPALQFSWSNPKQTAVRFWCQTFASGHQEQSDTEQEPAPKHKGVYKVGNRWGVRVRIPKHMVPGRDKNVNQHICIVDSAEEAAALADVYQLAVYGTSVRLQHLNYAANKYSSGQIASALQVLKAKHPGLRTVDSRKACLHPPAVDRSPVIAVAAKVTRLAEAAVPDRCKEYAGAFELPDGSGYAATCCVCYLGVDHVYYLRRFSNAAEAAVVYDLVRYNLYGPEYTVNFPPHIYTDSDAAVVRQDMKHRYPDMFAAAVRAATRKPPYPHSLWMAQKVFDAAVEAAEAEAEKQHCQAAHGRQGVAAKGYSFEARLKVPVARNRYTYHIRHYPRLLGAAAAVDMLRQAVGRPAVNFPASITAAGVPAAKVWVDHNQTRVTDGKQRWTAKAAALGSAPQVTAASMVDGGD